MPRPRRNARNAEIYERWLIRGETQRALAAEFGLNPSRIYKICQDEEQRRRLVGEPWGDRLVKGLARAAHLEDLEPVL